ncbi:hypothetical protein P9112_005273 [Eukaryota sp. TZLM1-RC]
MLGTCPCCDSMMMKVTKILLIRYNPFLWVSQTFSLHLSDLFVSFWYSDFNSSMMFNSKNTTHFALFQCSESKLYM